MSIRALEVLSLIGLLDSNHRPVDLSNRSQSDLRQLLDYYKSARLRDLEAEVKEVRAKEGEFASLASTVSTRKEPSAILASTLVYSRVFLNDPLFQVANSNGEYGEVTDAMLGLKQSDEIRREDLAKALSKFVECTPLIKCGAIVFLPLERSEPTKSLPLLYSEDRFRSEIPANLHDFIHERAVINEVIPAGDALVMPCKRVKKPCRGIYVTFKGEERVASGMLYFLTASNIQQTTGGTEIVFGDVKWDQPPDKKRFKTWVYQSINQSILKRFKDISRNMRVADHLGACYTTDSGFESRICGHTAVVDPTAQNRHRAVNLLKVNAEYLLTTDANHIARMRTDNPKLFERWQATLLAASNQLTGVDEDFTDRAKQLFEKEIRPQAEELQKSLQKAFGEFGGGVALAAGPVVMSLMTTVIPIAAVLAVGGLTVASKTVPAISDYLARRKGPAFIWNQLLADK